MKADNRTVGSARKAFHGSPEHFICFIYPFLWGSCVALLIVQEADTLIQATATLAVVSLWYCFLAGVQKGPGALIFYPCIAGIMLWSAGNRLALSFPATAGMAFTGAGLFNAVRWLKINLLQFPKPAAHATDPVKSIIKDKAHDYSSMLRKCEDGFWEISIHDLAASTGSGSVSTASTKTEAKPDTFDKSAASGSREPVPVGTIPSYASGEVKLIFEEYISPWFRDNDAMKPALCLLAILDRHADAPSVVMKQDCPAQGEPCNIQYQTLHSVTLAEHTLHVAQQGLELVKEKFGETAPYTVWPRLALCIIGHDLGKISDIRADNSYARLDHPALSADMVKECCSGNPEIANECAAIVLHHHGEPPRNFSFGSGLELLKESDARARRMELQQALGHLKPWKKIPLEAVAAQMVSAVLEIIKAGDMARDLFFVNQKAGLMYLNPDVLLGVLQTISKENYLWPEILSPDSQMAENALRQFMNEKMKPAGWLTENFSQDRFLWLKIQKMGKVTGPKPFVEIVFMKFAEAAKIKPSIILGPLRKSCLGRCGVISA